MVLNIKSAGAEAGVDVHQQRQVVTHIGEAAHENAHKDTDNSSYITVDEASG
jgi:hypothetical protein